MRPSRTLVCLSLAVAALALVAAGAGLFRGPAGEPFAVTTVRGGAAMAYGRGLYRFDPLFAGAGHRGTDGVTLVLGIPLLLLAILGSLRGSVRARLLLTGMLAYFLYVYATLALGVAYNELFLVYVALFSASLFGFALALRDVWPLASGLPDRLPRRALAAYLFASGVVTLVLWLEAPLRSLAEARPPELLGGYTTLVTHALDFAIIVPATFLAGGLLLRGDRRGYLVALPLLALIVMLLPVIAAQTASQLSAGVRFTPAQVAGPISGFVVLGLAALWFVARILRGVADPAAASASFAAAGAGLGEEPARAGGDR